MYTNYKKNSFELANRSSLYFTNTYIEKIEQLIEDSSVKCISFDFFDTIVFRSCPQPTNIFYLLGNFLHKKKLLHNHISASLFHDLRIEAEKKSRLQIKNKIEVTLDQIYKQLPQSIFTKNTKKDAIQCELDIEYDQIHGYKSILDLMFKALEFNKKVIVISDTYFPSNFLKKILDQYIELPDDCFFVSCEHNTGKSHELFDLILSNFKFKPDEVLHIGDNYNSDVVSPMRLGIKAFHLPNGTTEFWEIFDLEVKLKRSIFNLLKENSNTSLISLRARVLHHLNISNPNKYVIYGATVMGAVFSGFTCWIQQTSKELELSFNLCVMREGWFLNELLQGGESVTPTNIVSLSRRVLIQSSWYEISYDSLEPITIGRNTPTLSEFISLLCLTPSDLLGFNNYLEKSLDDVNMKHEIFNFLVENKKITRLILSRSKLLRNRLLSHVLSKLPSKITENINTPARIGFIDIGWNASIQKYLQRIFDKENIKIQLVGLYLMTTPTTKNLIMDNITAIGYLIDAGFPTEDYASLIRSVEILEQVCTPRQGSVIDFDSNGMPITSPYVIKSEQSEQISAIQAGILKFQNIASAHNFSNIEWSNESTKCLLRNILLRAMINPTDSEVNIFSDWQHDDNMITQESESLFSSDILPFLNYMTVRQFLTVPMNELYWSFGAAVKESDSLSEQINACISRDVETDLFEREIDDFAIIYMHNGEDWLDLQVNSEFSYSKNIQGLSYLKFQLNNQNLMKIRVDISHRCSVIRIDIVRISGFDRDTNRKIEKTLTGSQLGLLAKISGMKQIGLSVYQTTPSSQIHIDICQLRLDNLLSLKVEIGLAVMEADFTKDKNYDAGFIFSPFFKNLHEFFSDKLVCNGIGAIDYINSISPNPTDSITIEQDKVVSIQGWCVDEEKRSSAMIFLKITSDMGEERYISAQRTERQDVSEHLKSSAALLSGAELSFQASLLTPGFYHLAFVQIFRSYICIMESPIKLAIIAGDE